MKARILGVSILLAAALVLGCSKSQTANQNTGTADTTNLAQNETPPAGTATGTTTISERERQTQSLPAGGGEHRTSTRTRRHPRGDDGGASAPPPGGGTPAPAPGPTYATVPSGQTGTASLDSPLSSETNHEGDTFTATLSSDWTVDGRVVVPSGTKVLGHLTEVEETGRGKHKAKLVLAIDRLGLPSGRTVDVSARPETFEAAGDTKGDVAKIGGGTVVGGIIGSVTGNTKKGAAIGAVVGTGAALATRGKPVDLASGHPINVVLTSDARVPVSKAGS